MLFYSTQVLLSSDAPPPPPRKYDLSPLDPSDTAVPPPEKRPWYMGKEGSVTPQNCPLDPETGRRKATLLPEEAPDSDRVVDQLMYFPPK